MTAFRCLCIVLLAVATSALTCRAAAAAEGDAFTLLVFSKTTGFRHPSIVSGIKAIKAIGQANGFTVEASEDAGLFTADGLKPFTVVVSLCTTGDIFTDSQKQAFVSWFKDGHGWVGIHAAADCEFKWDWYHDLVGAFYKNHPGGQSAEIDVVDRTFPATSNLPAVWRHDDEWFNFTNRPADVHVVMKLNEASYTGGEMGDHPIAWWHHYQGGRAFYSELGHGDECYSEKLYVAHLTGAILWAAGRLPDKVESGAP